jgi:hypothetical protein
VIRASLLLASLCLVGGSTASAAQAITQGQRVRVHLYEDQPQRERPLQRRVHLRGILTRTTADSIYVRLNPATSELAIARPFILRLDRSLGVPSRAANALRWGLGFGLLGGILIGTAYDPDVLQFGVINRGEAFALGAGIGAVYGASLGALLPSERWRRIRQDTWP